MKKLIIDLIDKEINNKKIEINKINEAISLYRCDLVKMKKENLTILHGTTIERFEEFIEEREKQKDILKNDINNLVLAKIEVELWKK